MQTPSQGPRLLAALVIGLALGAAATQHYQASPAPDADVQAQVAANHEALRVEAASLREQLADAHQKAEALQAQIEPLALRASDTQAELNTTTGRLNIAEAARERLAQDLLTAQEEGARLRDNLAFFEQLIPSGPQEAGLNIRAVEFVPQGNTVEYRVLLMRTTPATSDFEGRLQFSATGLQDGRSATIVLESLAPAPTSTGSAYAGKLAPANPLALNFRQYQRSHGLLALPPDFVPDAITVQVLEGKTIRIQHTVKLAKQE